MFERKRFPTSTTIVLCLDNPSSKQCSSRSRVYNEKACRYDEYERYEHYDRVLLYDQLMSPACPTNACTELNWRSCHRSGRARSTTDMDCCYIPEYAVTLCQIPDNTELLVTHPDGLSRSALCPRALIPSPRQDTRLNRNYACQIAGFSNTKEIDWCSR